MPRTELATAGDHLEAAADAADDAAAADRLRDLGDQLRRLAEDPQGPDHGRLARIQAAMDDVQTDVDDETAATIDTANDDINAFRETLEGV